VSIDPDEHPEGSKRDHVARAVPIRRLTMETALPTVSEMRVP